MHRHVNVYAYLLMCASVCVCVCACVRLHDTSHHSPWLCAPPSPSSVSVRLLSIPAPLWHSSAAERCHRSSSRRLSLRSTHCYTASEIAGKQRRKYASRILLAPCCRRMHGERQQKRGKDFSPPFVDPPLDVSSPLACKRDSLSLSLSLSVAPSLSHSLSSRRRRTRRRRRMRRRE